MALCGPSRDSSLDVASQARRRRWWSLSTLGLLGAPVFVHMRAGPGPSRTLLRVRPELLDNQAVDEMVTYRSMKERRLRQASHQWRKEGINWTEEEEETMDDDFVANLKHGTNLLLNGAKEFPPWADVRAEHAERGHEWMEKFSVDDIWRHHCVVPYVADDWRSVLDPLERIVDKVEMAFSAVTHVKNVLDPSMKFRKAYRKAAQARWNIQRRLRRCDRFSRAFLGLLAYDQNATEAQRRAAAYLMILFEQDGVNLQHNGIYRDDPDAFLELQKVRGAVFNISLIWDQNIDRDMESRAYLIRDKTELEGVPEWILKDAVELALQAGYPKANLETGPWLISMHDSISEGVLKHAKGRGLREVVHENRARIAFLGGSGKGDNTPMLEQLLQVRRRLANVVGYATHADVMFTRAMASPKQAYGLLSKLRQEALPVARYEAEELRKFAKSQGATYELDVYDLDFWRERLMEESLGLKEEYIRQFFPLDAVLEGLFHLLGELFDVEVREEQNELSWAKDVHFYRLVNRSTGGPVASFFLDAHRRAGQKRRGFWASTIQGYSELLGDRHGPRRPAVHVVCDLEPPEGVTLLTHQELAKVFKAFGSALRDLFCQQPEGLMSGGFGLELDVLDMPAHFMERWAYDARSLRRCSRHYQTGEALPEAAVEMLAQSRSFFTANRLLKRCAMAHVDLELHSDYDPFSDLNVYDLAKLVEAEYAVIRPRVQDRELCSQPFNSDVAGAFYGDLWSQALAMDIFSEFQGEDLGVVGQRFRSALLHFGGGRAPGNAIQEFLQRPASFSSMLLDLGLTESAKMRAAEAEVPEEQDVVSFEDVYPDGEEDEDDSYAEFEDY
ncbi:unnamed protein product [Cladocopium goreaui]|uniref:Cytosolic oligopeptidase A n=1 Tax=Cladocopium goreaui TaxID=2562237 RepID=A0A9P1FKM0_9DINO|nr:unnamed protein product [Cladocopium goreaui]